MPASRSQSLANGTKELGAKDDRGDSSLRFKWSGAEKQLGDVFSRRPYLEAQDFLLATCEAVYYFGSVCRLCVSMSVRR